MAANYRAEYIACRADAGSMGWTDEGRRQMEKRAERIAAKLFGVPKERPRRRLADLIEGL